MKESAPHRISLRLLSTLLCIALWTAVFRSMEARAQSLADVDGAPPIPDAECLQWLTESGVTFQVEEATRGVRTPIVVSGVIGSVRLVSQSKRPALMDCELARALAEAAPVFESLGITELVYSAAYDYRSRRDVPELSKHANGLAIDVHEFRGQGKEGRFEDQVGRDFEVGVGVWKNISREHTTEAECIGAPVTDAGRRLRTLACRLKLHPAFRVIVTRDDNEDHRDHFHLEAYANLEARNKRSTRSRLSSVVISEASHSTKASAHTRKKHHPKPLRRASHANK